MRGGAKEIFKSDLAIALLLIRPACNCFFAIHILLNLASAVALFFPGTLGDGRGFQRSGGAASGRPQ